MLLTKRNKRNKAVIKDACKVRHLTHILFKRGNILLEKSKLKRKKTQRPYSTK